MNFDDDVPPDLVETGVDPVDEEKIVKVPITIVTGTNSLQGEGWLRLC